MTSFPDHAEGDSGMPVFAARVVAALVQAMVIYWLIGATDAPPTWPATDPLFFNPLVLVAVFVPFIVVLGLGRIRARPLTIWVVVAAVLIFGLGFYSAWRGPVPAFEGQKPDGPSVSLWLSLAASVFIAHALVVDAVIERRWMPPYSRHFDTAWRQAVQIALAGVFVGVFWGVLYLGAGLFHLIEIDSFRRLIHRRWFGCAAVTMAFAVAFHVTDVQASLIRGARTLVLTLFSWLLPPLVLIMAGFLGSLPLVSPALLWKTGFATKLLLTAAGLLVLLINACYQDGAAERTRSRIKRWAGTLGAIELVPVAGLAIWALSLRVSQYGWTPDRIFAEALILIFCCYALGYAVAAVASPRWLKGIEAVNFATAYVTLAAFVALFSPLADPARLMVASQVARLEAKVVPPEKFDFVALRFDGARWGNSALTVLEQTRDAPGAQIINARAAEALAMKARGSAPTSPTIATTAREKAALIAVFPAGRVLPPPFFDQNDNASVFEGCFANRPVKCAARYVALRPGAAESIIVTSVGAPDVFELGDTGRWHLAGTLSGPIYCPGYMDRLSDGDIDLEPHPDLDVVIGGQRFTVQPPPAACKLQAK